MVRWACCAPATSTRRPSKARPAAVSDPVQNFFLERYAAAYRAELDAFFTACRGGVAPTPSGLDGLKAQILADAATESARTGKPVTVDLEAAR